MINVTIKIIERGASYRKGNLYVNDRLILSTIEPTDRWTDGKDDISHIEKVMVKEKTAIPYGSYKVVYQYSQKFSRMVPVLMNVKGFEAIEIHEGNSSKDTHGCILVGIDDCPGKDWISYSRSSCNILNAYLSNGKTDGITLTLLPK